MKYKFSDNINRLKSSAVSDILKYSSMPDFIPLSAGNPSPDAFPIKEISQISDDILNYDPISILQYNLAEGYTPLRNKLKDFLKGYYGIGTDDDNVIITSGSQQTMDIFAKVICNPGDTVITENPGFVGALNAFRAHSVNLCGVPLKSDGIDLELLEKALKTEKNVKFIYTVPNFQNPTGITSSLENRKALYELAKKYDVLILEDNPYGDLRYKGKDIPAIKSLDKTGHVVYAGAFSKVISPGIRVAYCLANKELISKMIAGKQCQDVHTTAWSQHIAYNFMENYDFVAHLQKLREIYGEKAEMCKALLKKYFPKDIKYDDVDGGFFVWCTLPDNVDMLKFCKALIEKKVCVVPGNAFLADEQGISHSFRISFSTPTESQLEEGFKKIAETYEEMTL